MPNDDTISKLLKLKRYEQPAPGYFDDFLREFQSRQRSEIIHRSLWDIVSDRVALMIPSFEVPRLAYAFIAAVAVAASTVIAIRPSGEVPVVLAQAEPLSLSSSRPVTIGEKFPLVLASTGTPSVHYVLPTLPASYASARSF